MEDSVFTDVLTGHYDVRGTESAIRRLYEVFTGKGHALKDILADAEDTGISADGAVYVMGNSKVHDGVQDLYLFSRSEGCPAASAIAAIVDEECGEDAGVIHFSEDGSESNFHIASSPAYTGGRFIVKNDAGDIYRVNDVTEIPDDHAEVRPIWFRHAGDAENAYVRYLEELEEYGPELMGFTVER